MFDDLRNSFDFFVKNKIRFSRKNFVEKNPQRIERNRFENLYTKNFLEKFIEKRELHSAKILDIGCKNWFYARGEYDFFKSFCKTITLDGVEIDAHRLYSNFYSRYETSKYYTKGLENVHYIVGNLLDVRGEYDFIVWSLPFVSIYPHMSWGLPKKYFMPEKLLMHAFSLLNDNGQMLIINQGEAEAEIQRDLFRKLDIKFEEKGLVPNEYVQYAHNRYAFLVKK